MSAMVATSEPHITGSARSAIAITGIVTALAPTATKDHRRNHWREACEPGPTPGRANAGITRAHMRTAINHAPVRAKPVLAVMVPKRCQRRPADSPRFLGGSVLLN